MVAKMFSSSRGLKNEDDLSAYLAGVKNAITKRDSGLGRGVNMWLKKTPSQLNTHKDNEVLDKVGSYSFSESFSDDLTDSGRVMQNIKIAEEISLTDSLDEVEKQKEMNSKVKFRAQLGNISDLSVDSFSTNIDSVNSDNESESLHRNVYTLDDLIEDTKTPDPTGRSRGSLFRSKENDIDSSDRENYRDDLMSNIRMVEEIESEIEEESITGTQEDSERFEEEEPLNNLARNIHMAPDLTGEDSLSVEEETVTVNDSLSEEQEGSVHNTTEDEYDYSMEYDTDIDEENIMEEKHRKDSVRIREEPSHFSPPTKRQTDHSNKEQSSQTDHVLIIQQRGPPVMQDYLSSTPLLPYVMKPEGLEVLTAYSPAIVALQDLVSSQVGLTKHLIEQSRSLSEHMVNSLAPDHQYVTLDQTREYIASHKPRVLSYEEALKSVKQDRL